MTQQPSTTRVIVITIVAVAFLVAMRVALAALFDIDVPWFVFLLPVAAGVIAATIVVRRSSRGRG